MTIATFMTVPSVDKIPDFGLYMDQVITFMEKYYPEKPLTKTMINNYTKDNILFPTIKKKYTREHIMILSVVQVLKKTLSLPEIKVLLEPISAQVLAANTENLYRLYEEFYEVQSNHLMGLAEHFKGQVDDITKDQEGRLLSYAYLANYFSSLSEDIIESLKK